MVTNTHSKLTLDDFKLPNIKALQQNIGFGTQVSSSHNDGSLTITEFAEDLALPIYLTQGLQYDGSQTAQDALQKIATSGKVFIANSGVTLELGQPLANCLEVNFSTSFSSGQAVVSFPYSDSITESFPLQANMSITLRSVMVDSELYWRLGNIEYNGSKLTAKNADGSIYYLKKRWLHFVPEASSSSTDTNRKSLKLLGGTYLRLDGDSFRKWICCPEEKVFDLSSDIESYASTYNGSDFAVYLIENSSYASASDDLITLKAVRIDEATQTSDGSTIHPTIRQAESIPDNSKFIGRFHTLCVAVGKITPIIPVGTSSGITVGNKISVIPYTKEEDEDFYNLYLLQVKSVATNSNYDTVTLTYHPLGDYVAGDILPESVFCLSFWPKTTIMDGMCYNKAFNRADDIYLYSGTGYMSRSTYWLNSSGTYGKVTPTSSRAHYNIQEDIRMVGKNLLTDHEFCAAALGSNEKTNISGSAKTTTGGNVDTASRRMISFIGLEDCCGHLWQILDEVSPSGGSSWSSTDGVGNFGQEYGTPYVLFAGGDYDDGSDCGSRCRDSNVSRSNSNVYDGARGSAIIENTIED